MSRRWLVVSPFKHSPSLPYPRRSTRDSDADEEEDERRVSRGCTLQYQRALVKVLTQFHTTSTEGTDQVITMLGPDWQVDVTDLVQDSLKVADPRIAELVDRTVLVGLELGSTMLKVKLGILRPQRRQVTSVCCEILLFFSEMYKKHKNNIELNQFLVSGFVYNRPPR